MFAMAFSSMSVVLNSLWLQWRKNTDLLQKIGAGEPKNF